MLRSFYSGISGLRNHQQAMDVIGNNISNVNTPGFKSSRVTFMDTLSQTLQGVREASTVLGGRNPVQVGSGMTVAAIDKNMGQGSMQATGRTMDLAIEGKGFFIVGQGDNHFYTRSAALSTDNGFNLVTDTGDEVYGWVDSNLDGKVNTLDGQGWIKLDRRNEGKITNVIASATPVISGPNQGDATIKNLTTFPTTTITDAWKIEAVDLVGRLAASITGTNVPNTSNANYDPRLDSTSVTTFNRQLFTEALQASSNPLVYSDPRSSLYDPTNVANYNAALDSSSATFDPTALTAAVNGAVATPLIPVTFLITGKNVGDLGTVQSGTTYTNAALGNFQINGGTPARAALDVQNMTFTAKNYGAGGNKMSVEFVTNGVGQTLGVSIDGSKIVVSLGTNGAGGVDPLKSSLAQVVAAINAHPQAKNLITAAVNPGSVGAVTEMGERALQNGGGPNVGDYFTFNTTAPGGSSLENMSVARDGTVIGMFDNGTTEELARVAIGNVTNPEGLLSVGGGKFAESPTSGSGFPPVAPGEKGTGTVAAGFLEMSNVDLTREFTDMITTQRGFQANSRIITTSDEMLQDLLALKR